MPDRSLPFLGNFRDLVPLGFKFQKLFASNHRCYHRTMNPKRMDKTTVWIWQKGCEVEYEDYHGLTADIFKALLDDKTYPWKEKRLNYPSGPHIWQTKDLVIDQDTREVKLMVLEEHDPLYIPLRKYKCKDPDDWTDEIKAEMDEATRRYRKVVLLEEDLLAVEFLLTNNLIDPKAVT